MSTDGATGRLRRIPPLVRCVGLSVNKKDKPVTPSSSELEQVTEKGIQTTHTATHEDEPVSAVGSPVQIHQDQQVARCIGVLLKGNYRPKSSNPENEQGIDVGVEYVSWSDNCEENHKELNKFEYEDGQRIEFTVSSGQFLEAIKRMKKNIGYEVLLITKKPQDGFQLVPGSEVELDFWTINRDEHEGCDYSSDEDYLFSTLTEAEKEEITTRSLETSRRFKEDCRKAIEHEKVAEEAWKKDFANWHSKYLRGEVPLDWRVCYCDQPHIYDAANYVDREPEEVDEEALKKSISELLGMLEG